MPRTNGLNLRKAAFIAVLALLALSVFLNPHLLYRLQERSAGLRGTYRKISAEAHETTARYLVFNRHGEDFVIYEGGTVLDFGRYSPGGVEGFYSLEGENALYAQLYTGDGEIRLHRGGRAGNLPSGWHADGALLGNRSRDRLGAARLSKAGQ